MNRLQLSPGLVPGDWFHGSVVMVGLNGWGLVLGPRTWSCQLVFVIGRDTGECSWPLAQVLGPDDFCW